MFLFTTKVGLPDLARAIIDRLKLIIIANMKKDTIGKRYRRQDAIGTPYCITIDHDTLKDDTVSSTTAIPWSRSG